MTSSTLYELTTALQILAAQIDERAEEIANNGGALPDDLAALLDDTEGSFDEKVERVVCVIRDAVGDALKAATERDRLAARVKHHDMKAKALTNYLHRCMEAAGRTEVERPLAHVGIYKSPPAVTSSLSLDDLRRLPMGFLRVTPVQYALDAKAIIAKWKAKEPIPDGVNVTVNTHVRIR